MDDPLGLDDLLQSMDPLTSLGSLGLEGGHGELASFGTPEILPEDIGHTVPQLIHRGSSVAIYRLYESGFKVLLTPNPQEEDILKLLHEQNISQFLPVSCRKRQVTDVTSFNKLPALSFKWVNGTTLKEWLHSVQNGPQVDLNVRIRAAMAIAKTLSDFHDGGVVYNSLTPENIILSPSEGEYVATLIDLSSALIYNNDNNVQIDSKFEKQIKEVDLKSLGIVFNQLFRGEEGMNNGHVPETTASGLDPPDHSRQKRGKSAASHNIAEGLPLYLGSLISALVDSSPDLFYESVNDVFRDLRIMAENKDGHFRKSKVDEMMTKGRLHLRGDMFYGRQVQMSMLLHLFQSSVQFGNQPLMATISGYPGTGKSTLVNQIKKPLMEMNGCFIEGKFNKSIRPDTVLASALNSFFGVMLETNAGTMNVSLKWRIHDAIGSGSNNMLLEILPNLQKWMADGSVAPECLALTSAVKGIGSSHRLKFMFCKLIGAIACRAHPLTLFLDDLQWADEMTLDIIRMMMTDPDIQHFLFLGCYRDNEVKLSHPLTEKLHALQEQGISIIPIKIGPIEKECVNKLLSEVLCLPPSLCRPLSNVVHSKTSGIILFILRFLASLNSEGELWFSMNNRRWMYDLEQIRLKEIHGDVVGHMTEQMKNLSKEMRMGLKVAACLGPSFDAKVLEKVKQDDKIGKGFFGSCIEFGFLNQNGGSTKYTWCHDQIQQAAYGLIPLPKRESFHLLLGSRLFMKTLPSEMDHMVFFIVDNMNRGSKLIDDADQKWEVAQLNLEAGEKALTSSAFQTATNYLLTGLSHLGPDAWGAKYSLTLRLYDAASEALYVTGDFAKLSELITQPLSHARCFEDKLNIRNNLVRALAASARMEEGIATCVDILSQLGEVLPMKITPAVYAQEVNQVKMLLHGKSRQELFSLPKMSETNKLAAMQFLNHALSMTYQVTPILNPIIVFRLVKMSIEYGVSSISAFAFACYGAWLVSEPSWDVEGGHRMGRVANEMMQRLGATEMTPRLYALVYGFINVWREPWQACLNKHLEAYDSGAITGDMEYALTNLYQYTNTALYGCGENLTSLSQNIESYAKRAFQCKNRPTCFALMSSHQLALDLMGIEQNAFLLYSNRMTEDSCYASSYENNQLSMCRAFCVKKKFVAFYTGDLDTAAKMYDLFQTFPMGSTGRLVHIIVNTFIDGLIGLFFARKHGEDQVKWTNAGLDAFRSLRMWVKSSEWNFSNKLSLLEAEYYFLKEDDERAIVCYNASIKAAHEHRFIHEEGLAEEKLATYLLHKGRHDDALVHFINAKNCYDVWGAHALVHRVDKAIAILSPLCGGNGLL